jgi:hypothetical protein
MAATNPTTTRAKWVADIPDLTSRLKEAGNYLDVASVSEATGFSPQTILDLLSRDPITSETNPQGALSRPAARIGNTPLYSKTQVADCQRRQRGAGGRHPGGTYTPLPKVSTEQARESGLLSTVEIAAIADVHEQTVRKWISRTAEFPAAVAHRERDEDGHSGVPFVMRNGAEVRRWLRDNGYADQVAEWEAANPERLATQVEPDASDATSTV